MKKEKSFNLGDRTLIACELTVKQITQITDSLDGEDQQVGDIDMLFPDRLPSVALLISLGMEIEELEEYVPSEIEIMLDAAEEVNPTFAGLVQRLANIGRAALVAQTLEEPSAG